MTRVLLINPNTSAATTAMMVAIAQAAAPRGVRVTGVTARHGVAMIVAAAELEAAAAEVVALGRSHAADVDGIIIAAFGDPGLDALRAAVTLPVVGICEASMREAAADGRRFGVATVTPGLAGPIAARARALGLGARYTGIRLTPGDPIALAADPPSLEAALAGAIARAIADDGAEAVVIGGGPLAAAADALAERHAVPVIAPIPAAMRQMLRDCAAR